MSVSPVFRVTLTFVPLKLYLLIMDHYTEKSSTMLSYIRSLIVVVGGGLKGRKDVLRRSCGLSSLCTLKNPDSLSRFLPRLNPPLEERLRLKVCCPTTLTDLTESDPYQVSETSLRRQILWYSYLTTRVLEDNPHSFRTQTL